MRKIPAEIKSRVKELISDGVVENETVKKVKQPNLARKIEFEVGDALQQDFYPQYGKLTFVERAGSSSNGDILWLCKCACGNEKIARKTHIINGLTSSCGCARNESRPYRVIDMTGQKIGRWTVIARDGYKNGQSAWLCECSCGTRRTLNGCSLRSKHSSKSCGCFRQEQMSIRGKGNLWSKGRKSVFLGVKRPEHSQSLLGEKNPNWKGGITPALKRERSKLTEWRKNIFERDEYTCKKCNQKGGTLNAHHIKNFSSYIKGRFDCNNGVTLCKKCHKQFHSQYGIKNNSILQLNEYLCQ